MAINWYVLRSKPHKEDFVHSQLLVRQIKAYYPAISVVPVNPRARKIVPYFPGYLFVYVDLELINVSLLKWMPGSGGLLSFENIPAQVPEELIASIHQKVDQINKAVKQPLQGIQIGDPVLIVSGPFVGQEAIFDGCKNGSERVRVLIQYLHHRSIPVELPTRQVVVK